jgi:hypothetical protein
MIFPAGSGPWQGSERVGIVGTGTQKRGDIGCRPQRVIGSTRPASSGSSGVADLPDRSVLASTSSIPAPSAARWRIKATESALQRPILIDSQLLGCNQPVHAVSAQPEHVGRLGGDHWRFRDRVPFLPDRVPPQARNRGQWVVRQQTLPRSARAVAVGLIGVVRLALDFVGG